MTISSTENRKEYAGNGVTTIFAFPYKFLTNDDLKVYVDGTLKTLTTDYTVSGAGGDSGGSVTFLVAPANGTEIVIVRDPAFTQETDFVENDPLPAESLEDGLDKLTIIAQRLDDKISRALVVSDTDTSGADFTVPSPAADEVLKWNSAGDALETALVASLGALTIPVSVAQGGTGATDAASARAALGLAIPVPVAQGGTGATDAASARAALGLAIGTDVQAQNATLQDIADNGLPQTETFKNKIINGDFRINQRAYVSGAAVGASLYCLDRWKMAASADTLTFSTTANKTTVTIPAGKVLRQVIEGLNLQTGTYVLSWEGTAQGKIGAGSYGASGVTGSITGGTDTTIEFGPGTVANVQLETGAVATPFEHRNYGTELALCQRYYYKSTTISLRTYKPAASNDIIPQSFPETMRATPTVTAGTPTYFANAVSGFSIIASTEIIYWNWNSTGAGDSEVSFSGYQFSAEL